MKTTKVYEPCSDCAGTGSVELASDENQSVSVGVSRPCIECKRCQGRGLGAIREIHVEHDTTRYEPQVTFRRVL